MGKGHWLGLEVVMAKPQTFMNLSGDAIQPMAAWYRIPTPNIVVIHDDIDIPFGEIRLKFAGGHGGHNGLRSIHQRLGDDSYYRIRVGVGRPHGGDVTNHVLGDFTTDEKIHFFKVLNYVTEAVICLLTSGFQQTMNQYHGINLLAEIN